MIQMRPVLPIGYSDFKTIREKAFLIADKSLFIEESILIEDLVCLITRPRRFGKTMNMSMLKYFYDGVNTEHKLQPGLNKNLFEGLKIMDRGPKILSHMGAYPVVFMSLKEVSAPLESLFKTNLQNAFGRLYREHGYLLDHIDRPEDKATFQQITELSFEPSLIPKALVNLCQHLYEYHGVKPIVLIDEYDHPINQAFAAKEPYHDKVIDAFRPIFENTFKDKNVIYKAILTGVTRVGYTNMFSGLNNFTLCTMLDKDYNDCFGFTENEVSELCAQTDRPFSDEIKQWYNGYQLPGICVYNPWSIVNYLRNGELKPYWSDTGYTTLINTLLQTYRTNPHIQQGMLNLVEGESTAARIDLRFNYDALKTNADSFWMLLFFTGYLNAKKDPYASSTYQLTPPNLEIQDVFLSWIRLWFSDHSTRDLQRLWHVHNAHLSREQSV